MIGPLTLFCGMATLYLVGGLSYVGYLATEKGPFLTLGKGFWITGFILHSLFLTVSLLKAGRLPMGDAFEASTFFAWSVVFASYLSALRYRIRILGAFVLPLVFFLILVASFHAHEKVFWEGSQPQVYFGLHTTFLFLSYAAFALAFITGVMYLVLERQIKWKKIGRFYRRLPSLELLEEANNRFVSFGAFLYSFGILFGLFWSKTALGYFVGKDPKVFLALVTWVLYGALFLGRRLDQIHGRKAMALSIVCFLWIIVSFVGVQHPTILKVLRTP